MGVLAGSKMRKYEKDEYLSVVRFNGERSIALAVYLSLAVCLSTLLHKFSRNVHVLYIPVNVGSIYKSLSLSLSLSLSQPTEVAGATPTRVWRPFSSLQIQTSFSADLPSTEAEGSTTQK